MENYSSHFSYIVSVPFFYTPYHLSELQSYKSIISTNFPNGGWKLISGTTERESGVRGVWGGTRGWIHVESLDDSTREGHTTAAPLPPPDDWGAQDIQNEFPKGKQTAVTGGG